MDDDGEQLKLRARSRYWWCRIDVLGRLQQLIGLVTASLVIVVAAAAVDEDETGEEQQ